MIQDALSLAANALCDWLLHELGIAMGRWTVIGLTLGRVRPVRSIRSERWLSTLGALELIALVLGSFIGSLYG